MPCVLCMIVLVVDALPSRDDSQPDLLPALHNTRHLLHRLGITLLAYRSQLAATRASRVTGCPGRLPGRRPLVSLGLLIVTDSHPAVWALAAWAMHCLHRGRRYDANFTIQYDDNW
jgi:hypothetical protein